MRLTSGAPSRQGPVHMPPCVHARPGSKLEGRGQQSVTSETSGTLAVEHSRVVFSVSQPTVHDSRHSYLTSACRGEGAGPLHRRRPCPVVDPSYSGNLLAQVLQLPLVLSLTLLLDQRLLLSAWRQGGATLGWAGCRGSAALRVCRQQRGCSAARRLAPRLQPGTPASSSCRHATAACVS